MTHEVTIGDTPVTHLVARCWPEQEHELGGVAEALSVAVRAHLGASELLSATKRASCKVSRQRQFGECGALLWMLQYGP